MAILRQLLAAMAIIAGRHHVGEGWRRCERKAEAGRLGRNRETTQRVKLGDWSVPQPDGEAAEHLVPVKRTAAGEQVQQGLDTAWRELEHTLSWWDAEYLHQAPKPVG